MLVVFAISFSLEPICAQSQKEEDQFENHIRPLLVKNCISCHSPSKKESGLDLTSAESILRGGDSGPALVPGKAAESLLLQAIEHQSLQMPPDKKLPDQQIEQIAQWIDRGAVWPAGQTLRSASAITAEDRNWWCIQPVADPVPPNVKQEDWCVNPIDQFILARLETADLKPAPPASSSELYRRVHFGLTGLPPEFRPEIVSTSSNATSDWYEPLIDELLSSQSYGENQARSWLDLVRYAESDGYRADAHRPAAEQYRDYVIASFNQDKPYDRFIMEQLAGDEIDPANREALVGTMFLRHWIYEHNQRDVEGQWQEILDDVTETTADAFLALGAKCARCHDHKFDPLLQRDFFRLQAYFAALHPREDLPVANGGDQQLYRQRLSQWQSATESIRMALYEIENPVLLKHATREGFDKFVPEIKAMILKQPSQRTPYEHQIATLAERQYDLVPNKLPEWLDKPTEERRQSLLAELAKFAELKPEPLPQQSFVVSDVGPDAPPTRIVGAPRDDPSIEPGPPTIIDPNSAQIIPPEAGLMSTGRRTALARWIASRDNPLTARVIVNRIWQQHFGTGLAANASDFGRLGEQPSHPELLDWLATRFVENGWSIKYLHRLILTSATYRQTSVHHSEVASRLDPSNRLLWRMNWRRLSGEEIVDSVLAASGELAKNSHGRMIYQRVMRNNLHPVASLFDFPDRIRSVSKRHQTTTSTQSLLLMNNVFFRQQAESMLSRYAELSDEAFIATAYQQLICRDAEQLEIESGIDFMKQHVQLDRSEGNRANNEDADSLEKVLEVAKTEPKTQQIGDTDEPIVGASGKKPAQQLKAQPDSSKEKNQKETPDVASDSKVAPKKVEFSKPQLARIALLQTLMNSNEMIYLD